MFGEFDVDVLWEFEIGIGSFDARLHHNET